MSERSYSLAPLPGMTNMSIYVYFPAPIEYSFSDLRSVRVGGGPNESRGVIHPRFGVSPPRSDRSTSVSPATFAQRPSTLYRISARTTRDGLHPITYTCEYQPTPIHFCCTFICATASHEILMQFTVVDHFPTLVSNAVNVLPQDIPPADANLWARHFLLSLTFLEAISDLTGHRIPGSFDPFRVFPDRTNVLHRRRMLLPSSSGSPA